MLVVMLDVFADTPTQEQRDPPLTSFSLGALRAPPGSEQIGERTFAETDLRRTLPVKCRQKRPEIAV
jgi:hypothetical protein